MAEPTNHVPSGLRLVAEWMRCVADEIEAGNVDLDGIEERFREWISAQAIRRTQPEYHYPQPKEST